MDQNVPSTTSLLPQSAIDSLSAMFALSMFVSLILFALIGVLYIITAIRKWKVQSAILDMHKDIKQMKEAIVRQPEAAAAPEQPVPRDPAVSPDRTL